MKILHILNSYLPQHIAGTEVYVSALVRELKKKNYDSKVIVPNYGKWENSSYFFEDTEVIKYAEPTVADRAIITGQIAPKGLENFIKILTIEKPTIVHFHELAGSIGIGIYHVEAARKMGFKIIMSFHLVKYSCKTGTLMYMNKIKCDGIIRELACSKCWLKETGQPELQSLIIRTGYSLLHLLNIDSRFLKNSLGTALAFPNIISDLRKNILKLEALTDGFIVLTDWYQDILKKNGVHLSHLSVITQGLPNDFIEKPIIKNNNKIRLIFIGRISPFKGVHILLSALKQIPQNKVELFVYGVASDQDYMDKCLEISVGMNNLFWKGSIAPGLVINTIREFDILCLPSSIAEMSPLVIQEAFAAGIPVLASNVYGNADQVINNENGWLFKFNDIDELKIQLEKLIEKPSLIEDAGLKINAVKSFKLVADEHIAVYKKALKEI